MNSSLVPHILAALLITGFALPAHAQNYVVNGGFETGNLSGFVQSGGGNALLVNSGSPHLGSFAASFQSTNGQENILSQTISTSPGLMYNFSFFLRNEGIGQDHFRASFNGTDLLSLTSTSAAFDYTLFSFNVLATSTTSTIAFGGFDTPARFRLDDISLVIPGNLVVNGGFESGNLTGFVQSGGGNALLVNSGSPHLGSFAASFQSTNGQENILSQTINTTPGLMYNFSFFLRNEGIGQDHFRASFNGTDVLALGPTTTEFDYTFFSYNVLATSNTSTISFGGFDTPTRFRLDDISLAVTTVTSAPEPSPLFLLLSSGILMVGIVVTRTQSK